MGMIPGLLLGALLLTAPKPDPEHPVVADDPVVLDLFVRIGGDVMRGSDQGVGEAFSDRPDRAAVSGLKVEVFLPQRLARRWYLMPGIGLSGGQTNGVACRRQNEREPCAGPRVSWSGWSAKYGVSLGLAYKFQDGEPYSLVWLPRLKVEHLIGGVSGPADDCAEVFAQGCSGVRADNLLVSLVVEADFIHSFPLGCGVGAGLGLMVGDVADRASTPWFAVLSASWAFGL